MRSEFLLLLNVALSFYPAGAIRAHEIDSRSWKLIAPKDFHSVQRAHWAIRGNLACQPVSNLLTVAFLATHWLRTLLISAWALILLAWTMRVFGPRA